MPLITWTTEMELGVPEVDLEHEDLIGVINTLGELIRQGGPMDSIEAVLGEIHGQIEAHFALEEKIMRAHGFAGYEAHKEDHDRLLEEIRELMTDARSMDHDQLRDKLAQRLNVWFTEHFRTLDRSFHGLK